MSLKLGGWAVSILGVAAIAACTTGVADDDDATAEAANTAARAPLLAPTWVKCWVERDTSTTSEFFQAHPVKCRYDAPGDDQPIKPRRMIVEVHHAQGARTASLEETPGEGVVVARVRGDAFPLRVFLHAWAPNLDSVGLEGSTSLTARLGIERIDSATAERPLEIKQPFDLWPITILQKTRFFALQLARRPVSIAPFRFGQADAASSDGFAAGQAIGREEGAVSQHYFIAPAEGGLAATYRGASDVPSVRIEGPGVYVADGSAFRKATDEEAGGSPPPPPPDGPDSPDASAPSPDASAPLRECGVAGRKCCGGPNGNGFGGTCDDGAFCMTGNNVCVACGGANEKCCGGPNNNGFAGTCSAGTFCASGNNVCVACGKVGQKCCGGPNNNGFAGTCEQGGTCAAGNNVCVANP